MGFSASVADERVLDAQFTDDTLSVGPRDGRVIAVPLVGIPGCSMLLLLSATIGRLLAAAMAITGLIWTRI